MIGRTEPIVSAEREPKRRRRSGVYQILCKPTGKVYVGSAVWLAKRKRHHREALLAGTHHNPYLQKAWNKYGNVAFEYSVLEYCEKEKLTEREQIYLDLLRTAEPEHGFNINPRAYSNLGRIFGPEMRAKVSSARKARGGTLTIAQVGDLRERMRGNTFRVGLKHTEEARDKMKEARKGRTPALGMRHTEKTRKKISTIHKGIPLTEEHKEKIAQAHKGKKQTVEHRQHLAVVQSKIKPDQIDNIKDEYVLGIVTMKELAARYGCCTQTICNVINDKRMVC